MQKLADYKDVVFVPSIEPHESPELREALLELDAELNTIYERRETINTDKQKREMNAQSEAYDLENERNKAQVLAEPLSDEMIEVAWIVSEELGFRGQARTIDDLVAAIVRLEHAETLLTRLKNQLETMLKCEREIVARKYGSGERNDSGRNDSCSPAVGAFVDSLSDEQTMAKVVDECSSEVVRLCELQGPCFGAKDESKHLDFVVTILCQYASFLWVMSIAYMMSSLSIISQIMR